MLKSGPVSLSLPADQDVDLPATSCHLESRHDDNGLTSETVSQPQ